MDKQTRSSTSDHDSFKLSYYMINGITMYRLVSAPFLLLLALNGHLEWFRWLIGVSFITDAIDGPLSRKFKVTSIFGSRLDSVADDVTVLVATAGLWIIYPDFILQEWVTIASVFVLFGVQIIASLAVYKKVTSFHTYLAKTAAVLQAFFFVFIFFRIGLVYFAFYCAAIVTGLQLIEEIILISVLPEWKSNVRGLYWVLKKK
jgi:phosphatidylglycerophosphate synthase